MMDWFRWHHGTVTDRKWPRIASRAGTTVANVIAVWAAILESASQAEPRGYAYLSDDDAEDLDAALGMPSDTTRKVIAELCARGMIDASNRLASWDKRQPKRERDDSSAERVREFRRKQAEQNQPVTDSGIHVTPCNANETKVTPRGEEIRGEEKREEKEKNSCASSGDDAPTRSDPIPYQSIVDMYNTTMTLLPKARDLTTKRKTLIRSAWLASKARQDVRFWEGYFAVCADDKFLSGQGPYTNGHENWRPSFDYLLKPDVVTRVFEAAMDRMERDQ